MTLQQTHGAPGVKQQLRGDTDVVRLADHRPGGAGQLKFSARPPSTRSLANYRSRAIVILTALTRPSRDRGKRATSIRASPTGRAVVNGAARASPPCRASIPTPGGEVAANGQGYSLAGCLGGGRRPRFRRGAAPRARKGARAFGPPPAGVSPVFRATLVQTRKRRPFGRVIPHPGRRPSPCYPRSRRRAGLQQLLQAQARRREDRDRNP